jgi:integrase
MPTIRKRNGKWQVQVRLKGHDPEAKTFPEDTLYADAKAWGLERERALMLANVPTVQLREQAKALKGKRLGELIEWFLQDRLANPHRRKPSYDNEKITLEAFMRREATGLCRRFLSDLTTKDFDGYIERRLKAGKVSSSIVRNEISPIRHIFKKARKELGLAVPDVFTGLDVPDAPEPRDRLASPGELDALFVTAFKTCRTPKHYLLWFSLITTAINLGLRRGELTKIAWGDMSFTDRTLNIRAEITKTGKKRLLPIPIGLVLYLHMYRKKLRADETASDKLVFNISTSALEQRWQRLCDDAGIKDLHFHDLRRNAGTYFDSDRELTVTENEYMLGHAKKTSNSIYRKGIIERIRVKLDKGFPKMVNLVHPSGIEGLILAHGPRYPARGFPA